MFGVRNIVQARVPQNLDELGRFVQEAFKEIITPERTGAGLCSCSSCFVSTEPANQKENQPPARRNTTSGSRNTNGESSQGYEELLFDHLIPFLDADGHDLLFQQDNVSIHISKQMQQFSIEKEIFCGPIQLNPPILILSKMFGDISKTSFKRGCLRIWTSSTGLFKKLSKKSSRLNTARSFTIRYRKD